MTLIIVAQGKNFVVVGADSKGMLGDLRGPIVVGSNRYQKVTVVSEHVAIAVYGEAEFGEYLLHQFQTTGVSKGVDGSTEMMEKLSSFCRDKWKEWFKEVQPQRYPAIGFLIAGLDKGPNGQYDAPMIYSVESAYSFVPAFHKHGFTCRGIIPLATYILTEEYQEDMSVDDLCSLIESTISRVARTDPRIGLPVRIALVTPVEGARMIR
ncbi:MAG: hypothetical protein ACQXXG_08815 [Candidatus Bathyarchaeia archaeon]|jgi:20S proteasome alpha/beta subunit|nr:hypothetical protein [Candidatus Bathyarchaeota archaeon A05DMB-3]